MRIHFPTDNRADVKPMPCIPPILTEREEVWLSGKRDNKKVEDVETGGKATNEVQMNVRLDLLNEDWNIKQMQQKLAHEWQPRHIEQRHNKRRHTADNNLHMECAKEMTKRRLVGGTVFREVKRQRPQPLRKSPKPKAVKAKPKAVKARPKAVKARPRAVKPMPRQHSKVSIGYSMLTEEGKSAGIKWFDAIVKHQIRKGVLKGVWYSVVFKRGEKPQVVEYVSDNWK